jgi:hypothetical protein
MSSSTDGPLSVLRQLFGRDVGRARLGMMNAGLGTLHWRRDFGILPRDGFRGRSYAIERGRKVGKFNVGEEQSRNPEDMFVGKQSQQAEDRNDIQLDFLCPVRDPLGQRMDRQEDDAGKHNHGDDEYQRDVVERVGLARRRDEKRQVFCRDWISYG